MKLFSIILNEGRKEDLRKKYTQKFKEYPEKLDMILNVADLEDQNFKYGDFVLKNSHPNSSYEEIEHILDLVKDFDRFKQSLEIKDINKYDMYQLVSAIDKHRETSKSQQKKSFDTSGAKKLFEDKNILIVRPLTYEASCKYGAGTKWCTTMAGQPSYFKSHTSDNQALYYIILKNFNRDNKFYKIAIHKTPNNETWYDSTDERMSDREKDVFSLGAPKVIETIRNDYSKFVEEQGQLFFKKLFDFHNYVFQDVSSSFRGTNNKIGIEFQKPDLSPDMPGHATMEMNISVDEENIDKYTIMIIYGIENNRLNFNIHYSDNLDADPEFEFGIENISTNFQISPQYITDFDNQTIKLVFAELCNSIIKQVIYRMKSTPEFMASIHDGKAVWSPNRSSYGYTFKRKDSGLIKQLVDFLDSGKRGTKLDFLVDIKSLQKKEINGKPYYSHTSRNDWQIPSAFRGQLSGLFNSARLAGILDYEKEGQKFILKKGPNFEKFKEGELKSL